MSSGKGWYEAMRLLPHLISRDNYNIEADVRRYTPEEAYIIRLLPVISSTISIFAGLIGIYFFLAIDYRKRIFRHQLIFFLIVYDCIKALFLLLYPARVLARASVYYDLSFCKVVGFFTALSIEGSDIAILSFAIHIALLVFRPEKKVRRGINYEGGLFRYRYYVYAISIFVPILLASLAFINGLGYEPLTNWCYIPTRPLWYRLVLSWVPRYLIIITIFIIYGCVYRHVTQQYSHVGVTMPGYANKENDNKTLKRRLCNALGFLTFLNVIFSNSMKIEDKEHDSSLENEDLVSHYSDESYPKWQANKNEIVTTGSLNQETYQQFKRRRSQVERQMKSIFIYPVSYVLLWIFPLIVHALDFKYGISKKPIVWLNSVSAFMQPFNCTVDTVVFLIREKPWKITTKQVDLSTSENYHYSKWRRLISFLPLFGLPRCSNIQQSELKDVSNPALVSSRSDTYVHESSNESSRHRAIPHNLIDTTIDMPSGRHMSSTIQTSQENRQLTNRDNSRNLVNPSDTSDEMDFIEFLKMGPNNNT